MEFAHGSFQSFAANGFQQVVDAVHLKCLERIFVVRRGEDDRAGDGDTVENGEGRAVGQMDVHEHEVRHGMFADPFDAILDGLKYCNDIGIGTDFSKQLLQSLGSHDFVFNNQCFHSIIRFV